MRSNDIMPFTPKAAEALLQSDYNRALRYYNAETSSRGLAPLRDDVMLTAEMIYNEYHKEMFGEGQMWYNMKRLNRDIISNLDTRTIPASEDIYVVPIPQDEYNYRNKNLERNYNEDIEKNIAGSGVACRSGL